MAIFGTLGIFTRMIPLQSGEIALYRAILASFVLILVRSLKREKERLLSRARHFFISSSPALPWALIGYSSLKPITTLP